MEYEHRLVLRSHLLLQDRNVLPLWEAESGGSRSTIKYFKYFASLLLPVSIGSR